MLENIEHFKLTNRELEIMKIFWQTEDPMSATEMHQKVTIHEAKKTPTSIFTVQNLLKSLLEKGAIEVASYTKVAKTTAREYSATLSADDYALMQFRRYFKGGRSSGTIHLVSHLLDDEENINQTILELEQLLSDRKAKLEEKK